MKIPMRIPVRIPVIRILLFLAILTSPIAAFGQTKLSSDPPEKPGEGQSAATSSEKQITPLANSPSDYPTLHQPGRISPETGQIQRAWDDAETEAGVANYRMCNNCIYRVRTRELMVTTVVLPAEMNILQIDIGDAVGFEIEPRGQNMIVIRPDGFGTDTNMNVYTDVGTLSFYLRSEGFDSDHIPDLLVKIHGNDQLPKGVTSRNIRQDIQSEESSIGAPQLNEFGDVSDAGDLSFDPSSLRGWGDYKLKGSKALRPETVFRDDYFTYIHFGDKWIDLELPVAFVVIDGIDETVNTRVQGKTLIIESTARLISLKSGESYICIEYEGEA